MAKQTRRPACTTNQIRKRQGWVGRADCYTAPLLDSGRLVTIYVSSLADMPGLVRTLGVRYLVSIIQPAEQPPTPPGIDPDRHYRCEVHDIVQPIPGEVMPQTGHIAELIAFLATWDGSTPLLTHCHAGISRSSAVALIAHVLQTGDPAKSAKALRDASNYASPNRRIVALADSILASAAIWSRPGREWARRSGRSIRTTPSNPVATRRSPCSSHP